MEFNQILNAFRSLGGIAENIQLENGLYGRGLVPINRNLPVKIYAPPNLLPNYESVLLDQNGQIRLDSNLNLDPEFVSFYENYQKYFGWGDGGLTAEQDYQDHLDKLPRGIKDILMVLGWNKNDFGKKTSAQLLTTYLISRKIRIGQESKLMPIIELLNHSNRGANFLIDKGIKIEGGFKDEILVNYHSHLDPFHFLKNYRFASTSTSIISCNVEIKMSDSLSIKISRLEGLNEIKQDKKIPKVERDGDLVKISYVEISNQTHPDKPKHLFSELLRPYAIKSEVINSVFEGLLNHNRKVLEALMKECELSPSKISNQILQTAQNVIQALTADK